ncbi:hypothetical protein BS614_11390 [Paenibacillus xylanexedens]|uniref:DUF2569 domain-containing protein n=1 Tax=Paenibacillus xylanexedens TaxID=528191 RepID=UPI000938479C|nr:DUF2569 domain-containing protein [Paenibacillus xylanexedens]APO44542.1 hypothetical protein BS614_11390 [Paenibacillus xylanexedens]
MNYKYRNSELDTSSLQPKSGIRPERPGISGLGGWLILIQIGLWVSLALLIADMSQVNVIMDPVRWEGVRGVDPELYTEGIRPLLWFGVISSVILLMIVILNLVLLYKKKKQFPRMMIVLCIVNVFIGIMTWIMIARIEIPREQHVLDPTSAFNLTIRSILTCCIFIPYFLRSVRVKNTFVK